MIWLIIGLVLCITPLFPVGAVIVSITLCVAIVKIATRPSEAEMVRREEKAREKHIAELERIARKGGYNPEGIRRGGSNLSKLEANGYRWK